MKHLMCLPAWLTQFLFDNTGATRTQWSTWKNGRFPVQSEFSSVSSVLVTCRHSPSCINPSTCPKGIDNQKPMVSFNILDVTVNWALCEPTRSKWFTKKLGIVFLSKQFSKRDINLISMSSCKTFQWFLFSFKLKLRLGKLTEHCDAIISPREKPEAHQNIKSFLLTSFLCRKI